MSGNLLMNSIFDIINVPLGTLISFLYNICQNYALTLLLFAIVVKIVLLPLGIQQQKSQIRMAKIKPKEQAIRKKYAGRTDTVTQQKMQGEILEMYKSESYSPMSGCLPLIIQLPIIWALFSIIRQPLTYISRFSKPLLEAIQNAVFALKDGDFANLLSSGIKDAKNITEIDMIGIFANPSRLDTVKTAVASSDLAQVDIEKFNIFKNIDFGFFGHSLTSTPAAAGIFSIMILIPLLNFAGQFFQMRITKKLNANAGLNDMANNKGMKMMEYVTPLLILYMAYTMNAAVGLYWVFQCVLAIAQTIILAKLYPLPVISEEEYRLAEQQYGVAKKKKKKPAVTDSDSQVMQIGDGVIETEFSGDTGSSDDSGDSDNSGGAPKNKNTPQIKNNYQQTGKKYTVKRRKK